MSIAVLPLPQPPTCPNAGCLGPSAVGRATAAPPPRPPGPRALELRGGRRREPRGRPPAVPRRRANDGARLEKGGHQGTDRIGGSARVGKLSTPPPFGPAAWFRPLSGSPAVPVRRPPPQRCPGTGSPLPADPGFSRIRFRRLVRRLCAILIRSVGRPNPSSFFMTRCFPASQDFTVSQNLRFANE